MALSGNHSSSLRQTTVSVFTKALLLARSKAFVLLQQMAFYHACNLSTTICGLKTLAYPKILGCASAFCVQ